MGLRSHWIYVPIGSRYLGRSFISSLDWWWKYVSLIFRSNSDSVNGDSMSSLVMSLASLLTLGDIVVDRIALTIESSAFATIIVMGYLLSGLGSSMRILPSGSTLWGV